jgi:hypothetical protein
VTQPSSDYEIWVRALRAWGNDPRTDLRALPTLQADSLPPSAYERLLNHILAAQAAVMQTWQQHLERDMKRADSEHDYALALVELRALLGRRLQLAQHPGLPAEIQKPLRDGVERDVRRIQKELEDSVTRPPRGGPVNRTARERLLFLVRQNSFTAILEPGFVLASLFQSPETPDLKASATAERAAAPLPASSSTRRRRVMLDNG